MAGDGLYTGKADVADLSEVFTFLDLGDVDLDGRDAHRLHSIKDGDAGMSVSAGIDNYSVSILVCTLYLVDEVALMI